MSAIVRLLAATLLLATSACASAPPDVRVVDVRLWSLSDATLGEPVPSFADIRQQPDGTFTDHHRNAPDAYLRVELQLSDTQMFENDYWIANTYVEAQLCPIAAAGRPIFDEPSFGSELGSECVDNKCRQTRPSNSLRSIGHFASDSRNPVLFETLWDGKLRLLEDIELPTGGLTGDVHEHDPLNNPSDICATLVTARFRGYPGSTVLALWGSPLAFRQDRSKPFVISGEAIREAILSEQQAFSDPAP